MPFDDEHEGRKVRSYPPFWERAVPVMISMIVLVVVILLVIALLVVLGAFPLGT